MSTLDCVSVRRFCVCLHRLIYQNKCLWSPVDGWPLGSLFSPLSHYEVEIEDRRRNSWQRQGGRRHSKTRPAIPSVFLNIPAEHLCLFLHAPFLPSSTVLSGSCSHRYNGTLHHRAPTVETSVPCSRAGCQQMFREGRQFIHSLYLPRILPKAQGILKCGLIRTCNTP